MERLTRQQRKIVELTKRGLRPKRDCPSSVHWRDIVYLHLATIRKMIGAHNSLEMLYMLTDTKDMSLAHLKLTPRGKEVFLCILRGYADKEIGHQLGMSYSGVRRHKEKMLRANNCSSILQLVGKYYTQG
ncbi:MAG: LuxR C-terminal-related transcriptional regulator [Pseudomonadota bacterium]